MVYVRTKKGEQVTPVRTFGLTWPQRFALMLINGQRSDAELSSTINSRFEDTMLALADQGFIERAAPAAPAQGDMDASARKPAKPQEVKRAAVRWLTDHLGPHADPISISIERAANKDELGRALNAAHGFAVQQLGPVKAQGFARLVSPTS